MAKKKEESEQVDASIPELMTRYVRHRDARMASLREETEAKDELLDAMTRARKTSYVDEESGLEVVVTSKRGLKVSKISSDDGEEEVEE